MFPAGGNERTLFRYRNKGFLFRYRNECTLFRYRNECTFFRYRNECTLRRISLFDNGCTVFLFNFIFRGVDQEVPCGQNIKLKRVYPFLNRVYFTRVHQSLPVNLHKPPNVTDHPPICTRCRRFPGDTRCESTAPKRQNDPRRLFGSRFPIL